MEEKFIQAAKILLESKYTIGFTGAGVSVESGIPPFRGTNGLWTKYDPIVLELNYFYANSLKSWEVIKEIFYDFFGRASPNSAHKSLAILEKRGLLKSVVTQNIDNLHQAAGSKNVIEYHGNSHTLICTKCSNLYNYEEVNMKKLPITCSSCNSLVKPDFVFFGEKVNENVSLQALREAEKSEVVIVIGTTGEVMPACNIPRVAKHRGAKIIEINPKESVYTNSITDIFLKGNATKMMESVLSYL